MKAFQLISRRFGDVLDELGEAFWAANERLDNDLFDSPARRDGSLRGDLAKFSKANVRTLGKSQSGQWLGTPS